MAGVVFVLVGLQASGKSTFARTILTAHTMIVSKDDFPKARRRQQRQLRMIDEALSGGQDVIVDNTNPSPDEWTPLIELARARDARVVAYYFVPDVAASYARNAARLGSARVPDVGFYTTLGKLRRPTAGDGFDAIHVVRIDGAGGFSVEPGDPES
jgi:predicted kinase